MTNLNRSELAELADEVSRLLAASPTGYTSISEGSLRIASNEGLIVEGSAKVSGWLVVTGTENITGSLIGSGTFDWTGPCYLKGNTTVSGTFGVTGNTTISGSLTISNTLSVTGAATFSSTLATTGNTTIGGTLTVTGTTQLNAKTTVNADLEVGSGRFVCGPIVIDKLGSYGGRIVSTSTILGLDAGVNTIINSEYMTARKASLSSADILGALTAGSKSFLIPHPNKVDHQLRHGCTESPVAGVEYWGTGELDSEGLATVTMPSYFEDLVKPGGRTILVTGRGFSPDWGDIIDGSFQVTGTPGGLFSWLVKAERYGADFEVESRVYGPLRE